MKKIIIAVMATLCLLVMSGCNRTTIDLTYGYDYAIVQFPNGVTDTIELKSWRDYDGEQIQIEDKDGKIYLFHAANCVLVKE